jgi:hypothetical protein
MEWESSNNPVVNPKIALQLAGDALDLLAEVGVWYDVWYFDENGFPISLIDFKFAVIINYVARRCVPYKRRHSRCEFSVSNFSLCAVLVATLCVFAMILVPLNFQKGLTFSRSLFFHELMNNMEVVGQGSDAQNGICVTSLRFRQSFEVFTAWPRRAHSVV